MNRDDVLCAAVPRGRAMSPHAARGSAPPTESAVFALSPFASLRVVRAEDCADLPKDRSPRFQFRVPAHWRSEVRRNPHAAEAESRTLAWLVELGCTPREVSLARKFDAAGYVGIPFPTLSREATVLMGKYLSLWLLWDDMRVEKLENQWRIDARSVLDDHRPDQLTRFDVGWWQIFRSFAARRSARWIEDVCAEMFAWSDAAVAEATAMRMRREMGTELPFVEQLELRIATIGMYGTVYLLEDACDFELPRAFHAHPDVIRLKRLSGLLVGVGNDVFSFAKDVASGQSNLISTLMSEEGISWDRALERVVKMHDAALEEYDELSASLRSFGPAVDPLVARWVTGVRYASLGFSLWEAAAPRYRAHRIVADGVVVEPSFRFVRST